MICCFVFVSCIFVDPQIPRRFWRQIVSSQTHQSCSPWPNSILHLLGWQTHLSSWLRIKKLLSYCFYPQLTLSGTKRETRLHVILHLQHVSLSAKPQQLSLYDLYTGIIINFVSLIQEPIQSYWLSGKEISHLMVLKIGILCQFTLGERIQQAHGL